jgi:hypothetical protein
LTPWMKPTTANQKSKFLPVESVTVTEKVSGFKSKNTDGQTECSVATN